MGKEIERKFLVRGDSYKLEAIDRKEIRQGYLSVDPDATVRIRITGDKAFLTIKSRNNGCVRDEWEYIVPTEDAEQMLACCNNRTIEKTRYIVPAESPSHKGLVWEVDEFHGRHDGLVIAEIELPSQATLFVAAPFIGREVTGETKYYNSALSDASSERR